MRPLVRASLVGALAAIVLAPSAALACHGTSMTLLGTRSVAGGIAVDFRMCVGAGWNPSEGDTRDFLFAGFGGSDIVAFSPDTVVGVTPADVFGGYSVGPVELYTGRSTTSTLYFTSPEGLPVTLACRSSSCGEPRLACYDFTIVYTELPHVLIAYGLEGEGNPFAGCAGPGVESAEASGANMLFLDGAGCVGDEDCSYGTFCSDGGLCCVGAGPWLAESCGTDPADCQRCQPRVCDGCLHRDYLGSCLRLTGPVCRPSAGPCDAEEYCLGQPECPADEPAWDDEPCDDGLACTGQGACLAGVCQSGPELACDDGDVCTASECAEPDGCAHVPVAGCCNEDGDCASDGDACTTERCSGVGGSCGSEAVAGCCNTDEDCPTDDDPCTAEVCSGPGGTCASTPACIDGGSDVDAGSPSFDGGAILSDGGARADAGPIHEDAGPGVEDAGMDLPDAGAPSSDAGEAEGDAAVGGLDAAPESDAGRGRDAGAPARDAASSDAADPSGDAGEAPEDAGCACRAGRRDSPMGGWSLLAIVAVLARRRGRWVYTWKIC